MLYVVAIVMSLALLVGPGLWVRWTLRQHAADRPDLPGTGGELAEHLVQQFSLEGVQVEQTDRGDHYDPRAKRVRLTSQHYGGRSLTAVVVAAHEVGHAIQDAEGYLPLLLRQRLAVFVQVFEIAGAVLMFLAPVLLGATRAPSLALVSMGFAVLTLLLPAALHLVTLPVEFDASFRRALPILSRGGYLSPKDMPAARRILRVCALTYVAAALRTVLDPRRWARILFRR